MCLLYEHLCLASSMNINMPLIRQSGTIIFQPAATSYLMIVKHESEELRKLEMESQYGNGLLPAVVKAYRRRLQLLRSARDERDIYASKGCRFEKLKGKRSHQHSLMLTGNWRLIVQLVELDANGKKEIKIIEIVDYH